MKNKKWILLAVILLVVIVLAFATSYALFRINVTKNTDFKLAIGTLELTITDTETEDKYIMESTVPTKDEVALSGDGYTFTLKNTGTIASYYTVYLDDILLTESGDRLDNSYVNLNLFNHDTNNGVTNKLSSYPEINRVLASGYLKADETITYTLRMWVDYNAGNEAQNKYFAAQIRVIGQQQNAVTYKEEILNGADPVLTDNLVPVVIADNGTVTKADVSTKWYSYQGKQWANAVILKNDKSYKNGAVIPEENIESYFVWIPKYRYQLWDLGDYSSLTNTSTKEEIINIKFGLTNTSDSVTRECTTPGVSGESGSCKVGDYMTHPAFLAFDTNGIWVGKFETGYDGATSTTAAVVNSSDSSKIIIKPNVYSWRNATLGNMFKASYDYLREDESHMMKNTEWGAVAYLHHSVYGSYVNIRLNNNSDYITGYSAINEPSSNSDIYTDYGNDSSVTVPYNDEIGYLASTTGDITGIYDMSGGSHEYVLGYTTNSTIGNGENSGLSSIYSNFFTDDSWNKYYDKYTSTTDTDYNNRILGDATGEMGPFAQGETRKISSWYSDEANMIYSSQPWLYRGGRIANGKGAGIFMFSPITGDNTTLPFSFRIVLAPRK